MRHQPTFHRVTWSNGGEKGRHQTTTSWKVDSDLSFSPLLHLADITAHALLADGHRSAALLGTRFTMAQPFYRERLERHGLSISVPTPEEQDALHRIIFDELVKGRVKAASRERFITIMRWMHTEGAQAVILGCTEFGMLLRAEDAPDIPRVDTTELHCQAAVDWMLAESSGLRDAS